MQQAWSAAFDRPPNGGNWGPWWLPTAVGVHWSIPGAPRCPIAVQQAAAAIATLSARPWGNSVTVATQLRSMRELMQYASPRADQGAPRSAENDAAEVVRCHQLLQEEGTAAMRGRPVEHGEGQGATSAGRGANEEGVSGCAAAANGTAMQHSPEPLAATKGTIQR